MAGRAGPPLSIGCVYYFVQDMERAVRFYTRVLGLPLVVRYGDNWAEVDAGATRIGLHPTQGGGPVARDGGATVSFYVDDVAALADRLRKAGADVGEIHTTHQGLMMLVRDSEGNGVHFTQFSPEFLKQARYPLPKAAAPQRAPARKKAVKRSKAKK